MVDGGKRICAHDGCTNPVDDVAGRGVSVALVRGRDAFQVGDFTVVVRGG